MLEKKMNQLKLISNDVYKIEHLHEDTDLSNFYCKKGHGLEIYLKESAIRHEKIGLSRTYIIRSVENEMIVAYFTLRTGLITISRGFGKGFDTYTGIELANIAVNDGYREVKDEMPGLGKFIFYEFILPLVEEVSKYVGAMYLYIFALPENKLMEHYKTMGFQHASKKISKYIYNHIKPVYDRGCVFMYQRI